MKYTKVEIKFSSPMAEREIEITIPEVIEALEKDLDSLKQRIKNSGKYQEENTVSYE